MTISLKELKKNRLTPAEKWVLERIDGVEPKTNISGLVDWYKDGGCLFQQDLKAGELYLTYSCLWLVLEEYFALNDDEIEELLTNLLYDYTDNGKLEIV